MLDRHSESGIRTFGSTQLRCGHGSTRHWPPAAHSSATRARRRPGCCPTPTATTFTCAPGNLATAPCAIRNIDPEEPTGSTEADSERVPLRTKITPTRCFSDPSRGRRDVEVLAAKLVSSLGWPGLQNTTWKGLKAVTTNS